MSSDRINDESAHGEEYRRKWSDIRHHSIAIYSQAVLNDTSWTVAAFLLVNGTLSGGLLMFPFAYHMAGGVFYSVLIQLILLVLLTSTAFVLAYCSDLSNSKSYHEVIVSLCGKRIHRCYTTCTWLSCYGISIFALIVIGDQLDMLLSWIRGSNFHTYVYLNRICTIPVTAIIFIAPICYFSNIDFLRQASFLGILTIIYPVFLSVYEYYTSDINPGPKRITPRNFNGVMIAVPVFLYAYQIHDIIIPVYASMTKRNLKEFSKTACTSLSILALVYCTTGSFGYDTFGSSVSVNFVIQYDVKDLAILIGIIGLLLKMFIKYPQVAFGGRCALDGIYTDVISSAIYRGNKTRKIIITTLWLISTIVLATLAPDVGIVVVFLGVLAALKMFTLPGLCAIAVLKQNPEKKTSFSYLCLVYAVSITFIGLFISLYSFVQIVIISIRTKGDIPTADETNI